ncbi:MAG: diaminohydroxyphosphoribosylaminopyrimidine deaminase [Rhodospirillaceae bacterium]|nr:MAG: diaminohydroxyphosphoribosylaminopyrimidine deaminase [Rhodospirillaceae bacterium]
MNADSAFMETALALGRRGWGRVWPNPAVGCVLVRDGHVVGRGWTGEGGRPHAETEALRRAGAHATGATAYVTLEPCSHHGRTPPCAEALVAAGVARVVVAIEDPDSRVRGQGFARLREAGLDVMTGVCAAQARADHAGFLLRVTAARPLVTLKLATTLDGRIATRTGESRWITGAAARAQAHRLRGEHDAIMVGIGTVLVDDPNLTCRLPGLADHSPVRVVVDSRLRLSPRAKTCNGAAPTWVLCTEGAAAHGPEAAALVTRGVEILPLPADHDGRPPLPALLAALAARGLTRLLVEGGGQLAAALLRHGLVDRLVWFQAPKIIGGDGVPAVAALGLDRLADGPLFRRTETVPVGEDVMTFCERDGMV